MTTLLPGSVFGGRYRILRALKSGGMGAVYEAEHVATRVKVALKTMRPEIVADPDLQGRFAQEARISALIQSRHVVAVTDAGLESGIPFLVMELLAGVELGDVLRDRGPLSAPLAGTIVLQLARGLDKAHGAGVVHRDLKPQNVYLTRDEDGALVVKILDFGIAKLLQGVSTHTVAGGTPLYMAPEQTRKGALSHAVDVWALGLLAFRMLAGRPYWRADSIGELYAEILAGIYEPPSRRSPVALPFGFDDFFARCVALDPAARFPSAGQAASALAAMVGATAVDPRAAAWEIFSTTTSGTAVVQTRAPAALEPSWQAAPLHGTPGPAPPTTELGAAPLVTAPPVIPPLAVVARRRPRRWPWVAAVVALLVVAGVALAFVSRGTKRKASGPRAASSEATATGEQVANSVETVATVAPPEPASSAASSTPASAASSAPPTSAPSLTAPPTPPPPPPPTATTPRPALDPCAHCNPGPNYCRKRCMERRQK
ncbi:MAG: serine/threonine protein kinase [Polyangiaceae bacterium]|nr:serine/threonine protein kinase [Polyangiaceae bacterium]